MLGVGVRLVSLLLALFAGVLAGQEPLRLAIVDGTGAAPYIGDVLIENGKFTGIGESVDIPAGTKTIDGAGKTLLPGLFDLHTHLRYAGVPRVTGDWGKNLMAYLYCGVTSVVDFSVSPDMIRPMRRLLDRGAVRGPRVHFAVRIAPPGGHGLEGGRGDFFTPAVRTPRDAQAALARIDAAQPDAIKVFTDGWRYGTAPAMADMREDTPRTIVDGAHRRGWEVLTHTATVEGAKRAARAGVDVIDHGASDRTADAELISLLRNGETRYAPTLAVYHPRGRDILSPLLKVVVEPFVRNAVRPTLSRRLPRRACSRRTRTATRHARSGGKTCSRTSASFTKQR